MINKIKMTTKTRICLKNTILLSILISVFAQIYIYPFNSKFVLGVGVIAIGFIFSIAENINPFLIGIIAGILTAFMRSIGLMVASSTYTGLNIVDFIPAIMFYISYGILGTIFPLAKKNKSIIQLFFYLMCFDIVSNVIEMVIRGIITISTIKVIIIIAFIRTVIECITFLIYRYQKLYIQKLEHQKRYEQLNLMVSKIYAEAFYLQKSTNDLNKVMKEAYDLYEISKSKPEFSTKALGIAQNAHEIRKNNDRVLKGINQLVENVEKTESMLISEVFNIMSDNTKRQIKEINPRIYIEFDLTEDYSIKRYYDIFAILNNLIINAIEVCNGINIINVKGKILEDLLILTVLDNSAGIEEDILPYIFNVGFSTKFNEDTGEMSTGIGLCHVKNLTEDLQGMIEVESEINKGTRFTVTIPISKL
jgi:two-component system sensor histidine kinase YcbA